MGIVVDHTRFKQRFVTKEEKASGRRGKGAEAAGPAKQHWWQETTPDARARSATSAFKSLKNSQSYRETDYIRHSCLYGVKEMASLQGVGYARNVVSVKSRVPQNIVRQAIDTRKSKVTKTRPRPSFVTSGGNWKMRQKSKLLNKFVQGAFYETRIYEKAPKVFLEADISGTGVLKVFENLQTCRMEVEQVLEIELYVDEAEARNGDPRNLWQYKTVAREVLLGMFPDKAGEIAKAKKAPTAGATYVGDMVEVVEVWHLPSHKDAGDGLHGIYVEGVNGELFSEEWKRDRFPFVFFRPDQSGLGFWGRGVAEVLMGYQLELNRISKRIQEIIRKCSVPRTYVPRSAKLPKFTITNDVDTIIEYDGPTAPHTVVASYVPPEYFQERRQLKLDALNEVGVSEMDVMSVKPAGLNSAPSLREFEDVKSERLNPTFQAWEQFFLDVAFLLIEGAKDIAGRELEEKKDERKYRGRKPKKTDVARRGYSVQTPDSKQVEEIDWLDIDLDADQYVMQAYPVSSLPQSPAARKETLVEWMQLGLITGAEFRRMMEIPDLEQSTNISAAALDDADATISAILNDGKVMMPEPQQDLALLLEYGLAYYRRARHEKYPRKRLDNLLSFIANTEAEIRRLSAGAAPPGGQAPGLPAPPPAPGMEPVPPMPGPLAVAA